MIRVLYASVAFAFATGAPAEERMVVGDGRIDGTRISPYTFTWQQCMKQEGRWIDAGTVTETLSVVGEHVLRHQQLSARPGGPVTTTRSYFDRSSFAPLRIEIDVTKDGERLLYVERILDAEGYSGYMEKDAERTEIAGAISSNMLHGMALGLPLAAMEVPNDPVRFLASMVSFDGSYDVIATWNGTETLHIGESDIDAHRVDVEWHHHESGDVYAPGPDSSGGRFWLVPEPPAGVPYVPRYRTDTYVVDVAACAD